MREVRSAGLAVLLRVQEFRALWIAEVLSVAGDQLARVALALLVFARTGSASLTAVTYALTFVPALIGGWLLSGLADRWPRRTVLVVTDLVRAGLAAVMAVPGLPLWALWSVVVLLTLAGAPFKAAQQALLPEVLPEEGQYKRGLAVRVISNQCAQLVGFGAGGALVVAVSPAGAMLLNSATFVVAAAVVVTQVRRRPAPIRVPRSTAGDASADSSGGRLRGGPLVVPFVLVSLVGLYVVPEGLAAPYAGVLGTGSVMVGLLMAADPAGSIIGAWLESRLPDSGGLGGVVVPAALAGLPLVVCLMQPGLPVVVGLWATSGALTTIYLIRLQPVVVARTPHHRLGLVMGRYTTCLYASQGLAILGGGVVAERIGPVSAVAAAGGVGTLLVLLVALVFNRDRHRRRTVRDDDDDAAHDRLADDQVSLLATTSSRGTERSSGESPTSGTEGSPAGHGSADSMTDSRRGRRIFRRTDRPGVRGWALWSRQPAAIALLLTAEVLAVAVVVYGAVFWPVTWDEVLRCGVLVVLGLVAAEMTRTVERLRRRTTNPPHVNLSSVWTCSAVFVLPLSLAALVAVALYGHMWIRSWRRLPEVRPHQVIYNVTNVVLTMAAASAVIHLAPEQSLIVATAPATLAWLLAALTTYFVVNSALAAASAAAYRPGERLSTGDLLGDLRENALEVATLCMGTITALLLALRPWTVVLIFVPLFILHKSVLIKQLEDLATTDAKTGLLNAATWRTLADRELERARRYGRTCGLLLLDLDRFRTINNTYGHLAGDKALSKVGTAIASFTRASDVAGRWGGDEFVLLLPDTTPADVLATATRLRDHIANLTIGDENEGDGKHLSVSIGAAVWPTHGGTLSEVFLAADNVLFAAKNAGRGRVCVVDGSTGPPVATRGRSEGSPPTAATTPPLA